MSERIVKSTIKLSRNIDKYPFPAGLTFDASKEVSEELAMLIGEMSPKIIRHDMVGLDEEDKKILYQQGLITDNMIHNTIHSSLLESENMIYRLNDDDHLAIVSSSDRDSLGVLWDRVKIAEETIGHKLNFAFDIKLGYLTSRLTAVGTGLKISVVLHLPGIQRTGYMDKLGQAVHQVGFSLKACYSESDKGKWGLFELSNLVTIGKTEAELIESMEELIDRIEKKEQDAIDTLLSAQDKRLEDELFRAYGLLKYARLLDYEESMTLLTKVRMGCLMGYFKEIDIKTIDSLLFTIHPILIEGKQQQIGRKSNLIRAEYIQAHIGHV